MDTIKKLIRKLHTDQEKIIERRKFWIEEKKEFLVKTLNEIVNEIKSDWEVRVDDLQLNRHQVYVKFRDKPSGIRGFGKTEDFIHFGGILFFLQKTDGKIVIYIQLPSIESLRKHETPIIEIDTCEPKELDEKTIKSCMEKFLQKLIKTGIAERDPIGFKKVNTNAQQ